MKSSTPATAAILAAVALTLGGAHATAAPKPEPPMESFSQNAERQKICSAYAEVYNESMKSAQESIDEGDVRGAEADLDIADQAMQGARNARCEMIMSG